MLREVLDLKYLRAGGAGGGGANGGGGGREGVRRGDGPHPPAPKRSRPKPPSASSSNARPSLPPVPAWTPQPGPPPGVNSIGGHSDEDVIVCNCGEEALLLTVRKDGPNQGRQFYKCNSGCCNFFLWADQPSQQEASQSRGPPLQVPQASQPPRSSIGFTNSLRNVGQTRCNCNESAVTRTVMKDGPNKGRMFHTCGKPRDQQCGFFQWADENAPPPGKVHTHTKAGPVCHYTTYININ